ncbi:hypothetical protein HLRTI_003321, partial [Halorhabdus tiamatea SARL4B]
MGSDTPVGSTILSDPLDPDAIGEAIEARLRSRLSSAPETLTADVPVMLSGRPRVRGQWLVIGAQTGAAERDTVDVLPAATSVELLHTQALANARATDATECDIRDAALLTSDYLHSLAYATLGAVDDVSVLEACFDSLSSASQRLASLWTNVEETRPGDSDDPVPIGPVVMGAAGDLAGLLGDNDPDGRAALRKAGAALGIVRWTADRSSLDAGSAAVIAEAVPVEWSPADVQSLGADGINALLEPLAENPATET